MIIPSGTEIEVDVHGQLSIKTPGNLVLQNSGNYGTIESSSGSIRIEPNVQVEAVNVRCADVCYVQGSLTAWKVEARSIELEESARAHIILQETETLQVGREARLVGNFSSEKELFLLFSRFAQQMRQMPFGFERKSEPAAVAGEAPKQVAAAPVEVAEEPPRPPALPETPPAPDLAEVDESLLFAQVLLERETEKSGFGPNTKRILEELARLLRDRDYEKLGASYESLFAKIVHPSEDIERARVLIAERVG
ncbi:MAG: hypothetical protein AAGK22_03820 [Acidobacteriota bacterium]